MAVIRATDALRLLNLEHGCNLGYPRFHRNIVCGLIPAERSDDGRSWLVDEDQLESIAARMSIAARHTSSARLNFKRKDRANPGEVARSSQDLCDVSDYSLRADRAQKKCAPPALRF